MIDTDSILESTKKFIGLTEEYEVFNPDIIMHINAAVSTLSQLGVVTTEGYMIEDSSAKWSEYLVNYTPTLLGFVKQYIYYKVRSAFDPPTSSAVSEAINRSIGELEFRILTEVEIISGSKNVSDNE